MLVCLKIRTILKITLTMVRWVRGRCRGRGGRYDQVSRGAGGGTHAVEGLNLRDDFVDTSQMIQPTTECTDGSYNRGSQCHSFGSRYRR